MTLDEIKIAQLDAQSRKLEAQNELRRLRPVKVKTTAEDRATVLRTIRKVAKCWEP